MFCSKCGKEVAEGNAFCPSCGASLNSSDLETRNISQNPNDAPSTGFAVLGFFIPLVGLILYLMWKDELPKKAKSCGKGALAGFIVGIAFSIISAIVTFIAVAGL